MANPVGPATPSAAPGAGHAAAIGDSAFKSPALAALDGPAALSAPSIAFSAFDAVAAAAAPVETSVAQRLIDQKHAEYTRQTKRYQFLSFTPRCTAALCAVLLPFIIGVAPRVATGLSIAVAVCIAIDVVFNPKDLWATYSKATDLLAIARLKQLGEYEKYKDALDVLMNTEAARLQRIKDIGEVLTAIDRGQKG